MKSFILASVLLVAFMAMLQISSISAAPEPIFGGSSGGLPGLGGVTQMVAPAIQMATSAASGAASLGGMTGLVGPAMDVASSASAGAASLGSGFLGMGK